ncbi:hypothetical protein EB001_19490 [bacterium]|nr:hypothetical protein [bacterium]
MIIQATPLALNVLEMVILPKQTKRYPNYYRKPKMPPYNEAQNRLFRAAEHNPEIAKKVGIPQATAKKLAHEGVKKDPHKLAKALMTK